MQEEAAAETQQIVTICAPRRMGKTHALQVLGAAKQAEGKHVFCYAPSERSRRAMGFPILDLATSRITPDTVLLFDEFNLCQDYVRLQEPVLKAGGMVIRSMTAAPVN